MRNVPIPASDLAADEELLAWSRKLRQRLVQDVHFILQDVFQSFHSEAPRRSKPAFLQKLVAVFTHSLQRDAVLQTHIAAGDKLDCTTHKNPTQKTIHKKHASKAKAGQLR